MMGEYIYICIYISPCKSIPTLWSLSRFVTLQPQTSIMPVKRKENGTRLLQRKSERLGVPLQPFPLQPQPQSLLVKPLFAENSSPSLLSCTSITGYPISRLTLLPVALCKTSRFESVWMESITFKALPEIFMLEIGPFWHGNPLI